MRRMTDERRARRYPGRHRLHRRMARPDVADAEAVMTLWVGRIVLALACVSAVFLAVLGLVDILTWLFHIY